MKHPIGKLSRFLAGLTALMTFAVFAGSAWAQDTTYVPQVTPGETGCTAEQRRDTLRALQAQVVQAVPTQVESLDTATQPGGPLEGWRLSHGLVVLAGSGGVAVDNITTQYPIPQVLLYAPSPTSSPEDWLDFDDPDGPYRLVGWAYLNPYEPGSSPPSRPCIAAGEWFVHEAGWHLMDGGMHLTPDAAAEPPPPELEAGAYFWHPQGWDLHFWLGEDGVPAISFHNPNAPGGGLPLPEGSFYYLVNGRRQLPPEPEGR